jgi:predicted amidophosphoribosyltransferase
MNNGDSPAVQKIPAEADTIKCPGCAGPVGLNEKRCPHCGRPMVARGFFFYAFWAGLSLVVVALVACIFYMGFLLLNRML